MLMIHHGSFFNFFRKKKINLEIINNISMIYLLNQDVPHKNHHGSLERNCNGHQP